MKGIGQAGFRSSARTIVGLYRGWETDMGKVTLKSNGNEALSEESLLKSNGDELLNDDFP
jgi:hypothetical protein